MQHAFLENQHLVELIFEILKPFVLPSEGDDLLGQPRVVLETVHGPNVGRSREHPCGEEGGGNHREEENPGPGQAQDQGLVLRIHRDVNR